MSRTKAFDDEIDDYDVSSNRQKLLHIEYVEAFDNY